MQFLLNVLRINGIYMFRALLAHPQEAIHKRQLVYCVRVLLVDCTRVKTKNNIPSAACVAPSEDEQVMLETCRGH
jgi:hypothetical protein